MDYKIGTSGYSYDDWKGVFYPADFPRGKMLDYYARHFDTVEINSTYYKIPHPVVFYHLARKTPGDFEFIVKTHQETTHKRQENEKAIEQLKEAVQPLVESNKFQGFLAQFPYSFKNIPDNRDDLKHTKELVGDFPLFVEFHNWTWNRAEVFEFLREHDIAYVNVDQPRLRGLIPPQQIVTSSNSYLRFHGRNDKEWWKGSNITRYDYLYSREELNEWMVRISHLLKRSFKTYIFFNNHPQGKAVQNALMLKEMLGKYLNP
ncbi:MAG: DUF72 domain-containing protein [Calditrichia bacterium]